jgi:ribosomal protein S18 acetylase RimI-like enzyme
MVEPFFLTQALDSDADEIADVYLASRADALPYVRRVHTDIEVRAWIREVALKRGETWVAKRDSAIVGFITLMGEEVEQLYVLPGNYRRGIGRTLVNLAKTRRPNRLYLYTFQRNTSARAFYERQGFRIIDTSDGTRNEETEPDIRYQWTPAATLVTTHARNTRRQARGLFRCAAAALIRARTVVNCCNSLLCPGHVQPQAEF